MSERYSITRLCLLAKVARSSYYKWLKRKDIITNKDIQDKIIKNHILDIHNKYRGTYGRKRICIYLNNILGIEINHKRVYRLMNEMNIKAVIRKKVYKHKFKPASVAKNILNREFTVTRPLTKLCMDITYIPLDKSSRRFLYLSAVKDLYNDQIIAYNMSTRNDVKLVNDTLEQLYNLPLKKGCILHTDQGFQYTRKEYCDDLKRHSITQSMSRRGNCWDNAPIEIFFGHLKSELIYLSKTRETEKLINEINEYIWFYNNERILLKYGMSPIQYKSHAA